MTSPEPTEAKPTSLPRYREANKADKRRRIREAARKLFSRQGYEATTMRQIAKEAGVAVGTLSLYADDKRDLVLLIFNKKIQPLNDHAELIAGNKGDLLDQLVAMFSVYLEDAAADLTFARIHHQLSYYSGGSHSKEYYAHRDRLFAIIEQQISRAKANSGIVTPEEPAFIARQVFFVFSACLRWWVASQNPKIEDCVRELRRALRLLIEGMNPNKRRSVHCTGTAIPAQRQTSRRSQKE